MLRGDKVILRAPEREDLKRLHELERNVNLVLLGDGDWQPLPLAAFERSFERRLNDEDKVRFVIEADGKVIGDTGLHHCQRRDGVTSFGIAIYDPEYVGKGYGREAVTLLLDWTFRIQNYRRVWLEVFASNERAIRAYRACGFVEEARLRQHGYTNGTYDDMIVMGLLRSEWESHTSRSTPR